LRATGPHEAGSWPEEGSVRWISEPVSFVDYSEEEYSSYTRQRDGREMPAGVSRKVTVKDGESGIVTLRCSDEASVKLQELDLGAQVRLIASGGERYQVTVQDVQAGR
jgi:hypothetical protein